MGALHATTAAPNSRTGHAATGTENESIHGADTFAAGCNILAARAAAGAPANDSTSIPTTTAETTRAWNPRSDRASADAEAIDRALTTASNALKALIFQLLGQEWNGDVRKSLVAHTKKLMRSDLEIALASSEHGEERVNLDLVLWRMEHARAAIAAKAICAGCRMLCKHWERQLTVLSGSSAESGAARRHWLDSAVRALRDVANRYGEDPAVHKQAVKTKDPFRVLFSLAPDETRNRGVEALASTVEDVATHMADVFSKTFSLSISWADFTVLTCCVALPLFECFLLTKALDPDWEIELVLPGTRFSAATMVDPPLEVEFSVDERSPPTREHGVAEAKLVVLTTFPGIPVRFGVADTVLHRAERLPPAPRMATASTQTDAAEPLHDSWIVSCAADMSALAADLYQLVTEPILLNRPRDQIGANSLHASRIHLVSGTITRFLSLFDRTITSPHPDLHHQLASAERRAAHLRAELVQATTAGRISARVRVILAEHEHDIRSALDFPQVPPAGPRWSVPFVHNMYQWLRLVLMARVAGYVLVMPWPGDANLDQIECLVHNEAWECGRKVGIALFPNVVRAADGQRVANVPPCAGFCDRAVPRR
ncbi:hypothetical protein GGF32_007672 [Allomyces javanicus]|nr:hypothetical protein GGF32_007672 [Allomyces javanicus]